MKMDHYEHLLKDFYFGTTLILKELTFEVVEENFSGWVRRNWFTKVFFKRVVGNSRTSLGPLLHRL